MKELLYTLFEHRYLSKEEAKRIMTQIAEGKHNDSQIAAFISVYLMRSISTNEVLGFREALLEMSADVSALKAYDPIDIVGTGGDNKNTFNISTAACFVVAGAGYKVAKHGNYAATSVSGASNVLESSGVVFTSDTGKLEKSLEETGITYLHAPLFNSALKGVASVRKSLGVRSFFNILGPIVNPVKSDRQMLGVYDLKMARMYRYIYEQTNCNFTIVHGLDGYDEISLTSPFKVIGRYDERIYNPEQIGMETYNEQDLYGGDTIDHAARIFTDVLANKSTKAQKDCVAANAGFAIKTIRPELSIEECIAQALESIEAGKAISTFKKFIELNS